MNIKETAIYYTFMFLISLVMIGLVVFLIIYIALYAIKLGKQMTWDELSSLMSSSI